MSVFRYLKIINGYQRGSIFSGFKESGFWEVNPISPVLVEVQTGTSVSVPISITRTDLNDEIELQLLNLPLGMTATFSPSVLAPGKTTATLTINNTTSSGATTLVLVAGIPAPRKVGQFHIKTSTESYWEFSIPFEEGLLS